MISALHHIALLVSDREKALHFYADALGFTMTADHYRPERKDEVILLQGHGVVLEVFVDATHPPRPTNPEAMGLRHLCFAVKNIAQAQMQLIACGFEPEPLRNDAFTGEAMFFVKDPDGLPIEIHE